MNENFQMAASNAADTFRTWCTKSQLQGEKKCPNSKCSAHAKWQRKIEHNSQMECCATPIKRRLHIIKCWIRSQRPDYSGQLKMLVHRFGSCSQSVIQKTICNSTQSFWLKHFNEAPLFTHCDSVTKHQVSLITKRRWFFSVKQFCMKINSCEIPYEF